MAANPALTQQASRGRDDPVITGLVTRPGTASSRPGTRCVPPVGTICASWLVIAYPAYDAQITAGMRACQNRAPTTLRDLSTTGRPDHGRSPAGSPCGRSTMTRSSGGALAGRTWAAGGAARAAIARRAPAEGNAPWCAGPLTRPLPAPVRYQHLLEGVEVLDAFARAEHDRFQRIAGQLDRHPGLFAQPLIKAAQRHHRRSGRYRGP